MALEINYREYLYYSGEESNPFSSDEDRHLRKDVFWHYEKLHFFEKQNNPDIYTVKGYIKKILIHSLDEDKPELPHFKMYINNSTK